MDLSPTQRSSEARRARVELLWPDALKEQIAALAKFADTSVNDLVVRALEASLSRPAPAGLLADRKVRPNRVDFLWPPSLKAQISAAAASAGVSLNEWATRVLEAVVQDAVAALQAAVFAPPPPAGPRAEGGPS